MRFALLMKKWSCDCMQGMKGTGGVHCEGSFSSLAVTGWRVKDSAPKSGTKLSIIFLLSFWPPRIFIYNDGSYRSHLRTLQHCPAKCFWHANVFVWFDVGGLHLFAWLCRFGWSAVDITRSLFVISVNDGLASGSNAQHSSISFLHPASQFSGIRGLRVLLTIPPSFKVHNG